MKELNVVLTELGISKVRLAKYLGVSRQMLYNYLAINNLNDWPKEKAAKILSLLSINSVEELSNIKITGEYIIEVENRLNEGSKDSSSKEVLADLKGFIPSWDKSWTYKRYKLLNSLSHPGYKHLYWLDFSWIAFIWLFKI